MKQKLEAAAICYIRHVLLIVAYNNFIVLVLAE